MFKLSFLGSLFIKSSAKLAKKMEKGKGMHKKKRKKKKKYGFLIKYKGILESERFCNGFVTVLQRTYYLRIKPSFRHTIFFWYFVWSNPRLPVFSHLKIAIETRGFRQAICMQIQVLLISMHFCNQQRK